MRWSAARCWPKATLAPAIPARWPGIWDLAPNLMLPSPPLPSLTRTRRRATMSSSLRRSSRERSRRPAALSLGKIPSVDLRGAEEFAISSRMKRPNGSGDELVEMAAHACLVAKDAATNLQELLAGSSRLATLTLQQCESELDELERAVHQK